MAKIAPYLALLIGIALAALAVPAAIEELQLRDDVATFKSTRADIVEFREQKHQKGPSAQVVKFKYTVNEAKLTGDNHLTRLSNTHDEIAGLIRDDKDGKQSILVYYDAGNPRRVVISKEIGIWMPIAIIAVTLSLLATSIYSFVENKRRQRIIGRPARSDKSDGPPQA